MGAENPRGCAFEVRHRWSTRCARKPGPEPSSRTRACGASIATRAAIWSRTWSARGASGPPFRPRRRLLPRCPNRRRMARRALEGRPSSRPRDIRTAHGARRSDNREARRGEVSRTMSQRGSRLLLSSRQVSIYPPKKPRIGRSRSRITLSRDRAKRAGAGESISLSRSPLKARRIRLLFHQLRRI